MNKYCILTIAANEDQYLEEWINYHLKFQCFDIKIIENNYSHIVKNNLINLKNVQFIKYCSKNQIYSYSNLGIKFQTDIYNQFINVFYKEYKYILCIDVDEFFVPKTQIDLIFNCDSPGVFIKWRIFGDSFQDTVKNQFYSVLKRFVYCSKKLHENGKSAINCKYFGKYTFQTPHNIGINANNLYTQYYNNAEIFHFRNKTLQERLNRIKQKTDIHFDKYNCNEILNTTARDFLYPP